MFNGRYIALIVTPVSIRAGGRGRLLMQVDADEMVEEVADPLNSPPSPPPRLQIDHLTKNTITFKLNKSEIGR
jgi:hypothetical protein